ncbi:hypothetical protein ACFZBE_41550, partial [Streptomyces sp. NPDC008061]
WNGSSRLSANQQHPSPASTPHTNKPPFQRQVAELEASERKLATGRDILRKAAKYFAGETNW